LSIYTKKVFAETSLKIHREKLREKNINFWPSSLNFYIPFVFKLNLNSLLKQAVKILVP